MSLTNCRFYEEKYPEIDSFVMVNVRLLDCLVSKYTILIVSIGQASTTFLRNCRLEERDSHKLRLQRWAPMLNY